MVVTLDHRRLEAPQNMVPEVDRVREVFEAEAVLGEPGNRQPAGDRAEREDSLVVADREGPGLGFDGRGSPGRFQSGQPAQEEVRVRAHEPQRDDDVTWLERPRGCLREERCEEHEVLEADDRRAALSEEPRDVGAGEAASEDERPAACVPGL